MAAKDTDNRLSSASRRSFLSLSAAASAAVALRIVTEPMLAHARARGQEFPKDAIRIDANENPLGPGHEPASAPSQCATQPRPRRRQTS